MTPEEGTKQAEEMKRIIVEAFAPENCLENMDDLVGELDVTDINRVRYALSSTEDYFHLKAVQDALKVLDCAWFHSVMDDVDEYLHHSPSKIDK
jgi:hypothetical protein